MTVHLTAGTVAAITAAAAFAGFFISDYFYHCKRYRYGKCDYYDNVPVIHGLPHISPLLSGTALRECMFCAGCV